MSVPPRVSVVIATRNAMPFLPDALDSVAAQTRAVFEVIVMDGRSTDATESVARARPGVTFMQQTTDGFAGAWNDGIAAARGDCIAFLDSDDRWTPDKLARQAGWLAADPALDGVIGHVQFFLEPGYQRPPGLKPELLDTAHVAPMPGTLMVRRSVFDRIGTFSPAWAIATDVDWFARAKDAGIRFGVVPEIVLYKRVHDHNLSLVAAKTTVVNDEILAVLHRSIQRQRAGTTSSS